MNPRIKIAQIAPEAYAPMLALENYIDSTGLDKKLYELIKIRASQINGCAYCINMHTRDAIKFGESTQRIFLLDAWRETDLYSEKERAVLALTEAMTLITKQHVPDEIYDAAATLLTENELVAVMMSIVAINGWNRIAIATELELD